MTELRNKKDEEKLHSKRRNSIRMSKKSPVKQRPQTKNVAPKKPQKVTRNKAGENISFFYKKGEIDKPFFILVIILLVIGTVMMFSASYAWGLAEVNDGFYYLKRQLFMGGIGVAAMIFMSFVNYRFFLRVKFVYFIFISAYILLLYTTFFGNIHNGARRWVSIAGIEFQSSELMKFAIVIVFGYIISKNYKKMKKFSYGILPFGIILALVAVLLMRQPHLSCTILIAGVGFTMILVGGANIRHFVELGIAGIVGIGSLVAYKIMSQGYGYFQVRMKSWLDPFADVSDKTWQTCQSLIAIGSGGLFGMGFGNSRQKFLYLPESKNDFVFAIVCEELGMVGAVTVLLLFGLFIFRGFYIASKSQDKFGMMLAVGFTMQIGLQALLNIAVVTNSIPNTGISLPFFSYGGTALIMQLATMGVILNISRQATVEQ